MFKTYDFISPTVFYECPLCGKNFTTCDEAKNCIEKHNIPEKIIGYSKIKFGYNHPYIIYVKLNNGDEVEYIFTEVTKKGGESDDIA